MEKIRKGDEVIVITGKDKGKRGSVLRRVDGEHVLVEGVSRAKKHMKPNPVKGVAGGIVYKDMPIHLSNVAPVSYTHLDVYKRQRMQLATQQLSNTSQMSKVRRDIARVRTLIREKAVQQ